MNLGEFLLLMLVGATASAINTVAGGGSLISFPTLLGLGYPDILSNATNSVALWPGSLAGALGYRNLLARTGRYFKIFIGPTLVGSTFGAWLLTKTPDADFQKIIPFLVLTAVVMLVLQPKIKERAKHAGGMPLWLGLTIQFLVAVYGGYFGAGMGIMMLGAFALTMEGDIHELNAVKNWLGLFINLVASVFFMATPAHASAASFMKHGAETTHLGLVLLWVALPLTIGSIVGGYASARISQRFDPEKMRMVIVAYGFVMVLYFFYRAFIA